MANTDRNYSSISPSAKVLSHLKALTQIPFAKETAALMPQEAQDLPPADHHTPYFWGRVVHFEQRYWSIDQLLEELPVKNILELSSGFSFRGLDKVLHDSNCHYIDTDLPDVIRLTEAFLAQLKPDPAPVTGRLEMAGLNAMDAQAFREVTARFAAGPIAVVNEGLLMYLDRQEKEQLCRSVREALQVPGGCWLTADIYVRPDTSDTEAPADDPLNRFFEQHRIRDNMFDSFGAAADFFREQGFRVAREADVDPARLAGLQYFREQDTGAQLEAMSRMRKLQATWQLEPAT